ncbi:MAG: serine/threonine protein kinase, partial [Deltaproteobacteria bacterium]|nr:serine/threonine protein kinase [Deltaproteobacteria bacterium]MBW2533866.1 serine/threonine protein kinase [Deltaproteobacteria bacterium]
MPPPEPGQWIGGRYRLERQIGRGGMGTVWEADDAKLKRPVAVKIMVPGPGGSESVARFEREAVAVARLRSPHIVEVHDYGVEQGLPYMVMELLSGQSLSARLRQTRVLRLEQAAQLVRQIARALEAAHDEGIVHRDLKPQNIFLVHDRDEELVKVFDFGIAKALNNPSDGKPLTQVGSILGTPRYMAPEQLMEATAVDHRADLWALAVIAYRMLTGKLPFDGASVADQVNSLMADQPPRPTELNPELPEEIDRWFDRALARKPDERFQSARELATALCDMADVSLTSAMSLADDAQQAALPAPLGGAAVAAGGAAATDPPGAGLSDSTLDASATTLVYHRDSGAPADPTPMAQVTPQPVPPRSAPPGAAPSRRAGVGLAVGAGALVIGTVLALGL